MSTPTTIKTALQAAIRKANNATGAGDTTVTDAVDSLIEGYGKGGVEPSGSITITQNGTYDVTEKAQAVVNVPASGITPSGSIDIRQNGIHDVTNYASANVAVPTGMNAKVFTATVASDVTSGNYQLLPANDFLASIKSDPNAFVLAVSLNQQASTTMYSLWVIANFVLAYTGANARKALCVRTTASANNVVGYGGGVSGTNGAGHLQVESDGRLLVKSCNTTYPLRAGEYLIIAGLKEML